MDGEESLMVDGNFKFEIMDGSIALERAKLGRKG